MRLEPGSSYPIGDHQVFSVHRVQKETCNATLVHEEPDGNPIIIRLDDLPILQARHFLKLAKAYSSGRFPRSRIKTWIAVQLETVRHAVREEARYQSIRRKTGKKTADLLREWGTFKDYARRTRRRARV